MSTYQTIQTYLRGEAEMLLDFNTPKISKEHLHLPSSTHTKDVFSISDRSSKVIKSF